MMDQLDFHLLRILQEDGRITISNLSKQLALSRPSVTERLNRLREKGIIEGFTARVCPRSVGRNIVVFIQLSNFKTASGAEFEKKIMNDPDIIEIHRLTGPVSYLLKAALPGMEQLNDIIERLNPYGNVNTSIVLSSPMPSNPISPVEKDISIDYQTGTKN